MLLSTNAVLQSASILTSTGSSSIFNKMPAGIHSSNGYLTSSIVIPFDIIIISKRTTIFQWPGYAIDDLQDTKTHALFVFLRGKILYQVLTQEEASNKPESLAAW